MTKEKNFTFFHVQREAWEETIIIGLLEAIEARETVQKLLGNDIQAVT